MESSAMTLASSKGGQVTGWTVSRDFIDVRLSLHELPAPHLGHAILSVSISLHSAWPHTGIRGFSVW